MASLFYGNMFTRGCGLVNRREWGDVFPFLREITEEEWSRVNPSVQKVTAGTIVLVEGDTIPFVPLVLSGSIRVYKMSEQGRELTLYRVRKGESCVLMVTSVLGEQSYPAFAVAEEDTHMFVVPIQSFIKWMPLYPSFQQFVYQLISKRLLTVMTLIEEIVFQRVDERIADYLYVHTSPQTTTISITQEELAVELGTAREVVSRVLKSFSKDHLVQVRRGVIEVINRERLKQRS